MRRISQFPWNLNINKDYAPSITIMIPAHNEEKIITLKLHNLLRVDYPKEKMQTILIDDRSTDRTLEKAKNFINEKYNLDLILLSNKEPGGKSKALNLALQYAKGEIIIVSDADCFWRADILIKAIPFFSDPSVGAVTGLEEILNPMQTWITKTETFYNDIVHTIRTGESKIHSTIFFQGGFGAFRRSIFNEFYAETDDSGTALNIVQKKFRTILVQDAVYFTTFPNTFKGKFFIKIRRAGSQIKLWAKCLRMFIRRELRLPKRIFLSEAFMYLINPIFFIILVGTTLFIMLTEVNFLIIFSILLTLILVNGKSRKLFIEVIQNHLFLTVALVRFLLKKKKIWKNADESRSLLSSRTLKREKLI